MKTKLHYSGLSLRISRECGKDRFTKKEVIEAIDNGQAIVSGYNSNFLCRKGDGKILAEIEKKEQ